MDLSKMDIVYIVREGEHNEELRHSLRSVAENVPHRNIVIAGFIPSWVKNVTAIPVKNTAPKYEQAELNWQAVCDDPRVSDDFVLFNDDFFVLNPIKAIPVLHRGSLDEVLKYYEQLRSDYYHDMLRTKEVLQTFGYDGELYSYALHIPMVMNKEKRTYVKNLYLERYPYLQKKPIQMRTLYGNFYHLGGIEADDVKVYRGDMKFNRDQTFLSTDDYTFATGDVGKFLVGRFNKKCKYEV